MAASTAPAKSRASIERCEALSEVLADKWWAVGLRGLLGVAFGLICLLVPAAAILALILLFSAYMLVDGMLAIASGIKAAYHSMIKRYHPDRHHSAKLRQARAIP